MSDTIGTRIIKLREQQGKQTQQQLADSVGVSRELVKAWEKGSRKTQTDDLIKLAEHFDVTTDYLLGLTTVRKQTPTLRSVEEYTGLSEAAIMTIANATGSYAKCWDTINSMDLDRYSDSDVNPFLDEKAVEALDDLLKDGDGRFLAALAEIKRLTGEINDVWEDWKTSGTDEPPLSLQEAIQLHRDLRYALFDLSEEAKASVDDLYAYDESLNMMQKTISRFPYLLCLK